MFLQPPSPPFSPASLTVPKLMRMEPSCVYACGEGVCERQSACVHSWCEPCLAREQACRATLASKGSKKKEKKKKRTTLTTAPTIQVGRAMMAPWVTRLVDTFLWCVVCPYPARGACVGEKNGGFASPSVLSSKWGVEPTEGRERFFLSLTSPTDAPARL